MMQASGKKILAYMMSAMMLTGCGKDIYDVNQKKLKLKAKKSFLDVKDGVEGPFITARVEGPKQKIKGFDVVYKKGNETLSAKAISDGNKIVFLPEIVSLRHSRTDENGVMHVTEYERIKKTHSVLAPDSTVLIKTRTFADIEHAIPLWRKFVRAGKDASFHAPTIYTPHYSKQMQEEVEKQKAQIIQFAGP